MTDKKPFDIGIIVKPHGIKGELRVFPVTDDPSRFGLLDSVAVTMKDGSEREYEIMNARAGGGAVILKFKGIDDRDGAGGLTGGVIKVPFEKALPLGEDEYYVRDLIGMDVCAEDGEKIGELSDVAATGANDVYVVSSKNKKDILIPAIKDCIIDISTDEKKITVRLMEGLI
jgi:16S rRNA processing protein RimM